jgi:hypothetical protein
MIASSDMHGNVDHRPLIRVAGEYRQQDQMTRRGNRQKFGDALHDREEQHLNEGHGHSICWLGRVLAGRYVGLSRNSVSQSHCREENIGPIRSG